jgi:hypothetical protein
LNFFIKLLLVFYLLGIDPLPTTESSWTTEDNVRGITMVAPPGQFSDDPIDPIKDVNADWIAVVPYGYSRKGSPEVRYNSSWQWWGERPDGIRESIRVAHLKGMKVMVKPQVYVPGGWIGDMDFDTEEEWRTWEATYQAYIMAFVKIAVEEGADMICIGTEYKIAARKREAFWRQLISEVRSSFNGQVIYSSNWDGYEKVPFWDALDYVGISAYFPLTSTKTPTVNYLKKEWRPITKKLKRFSDKMKKEILFTEFGYLSVDGCAYKAWELEKKIKDLPINEEAQANAYHALLSTFWNEDYWAGGFLWKWFPNMEGHEGYPDKDYTPQGKVAEQVIREWYGK